MDSKLLTESGWKAIASKFKVKDNGLQRALATYEKLNENQYDERLKAIASVSQLAGSMTKAKDAAAVPEVAKYLGDLLSTSDDGKAEIAKVKAAAEKAHAVAQKKADSQAKQQQEDEQEEDEQGEYHVKLLAAFQKLKSAKDLSFEFIVCDAKPHAGLMVAKKITPTHKEELTKITGGSKRFLHIGLCHFENGHFVFVMEQPVSGLARKLQDSIKNFTGKKLPIVMGAESVEADDASTVAGEPGVGAAAKPEPPALGKAPELWRQAERRIAGNLDQLKQAVKKEFAGHDAAVVAQIDQNMKRLDGIFERLDHKLADSLTKAHAARDAASRAAELKNAKAILLDYGDYMKADHELIGHIDDNPFGIKINLKQELFETMAHMAKAIGTLA